MYGFSPECTVVMLDDTKKMFKDLKPKDKVRTPLASANILAIVIYDTFNCEIEMVKFSSDLIVTPTYPILLNDYTNKWVHACDVGEVTKIKMNKIYNLILDADHIIYVNRMKCCTLGNNLYINDKIKHPYYGSSKIKYDLKNHVDWNSGFIILS